jgi:hypothetical protein
MKVIRVQCFDSVLSTSDITTWHTSWDASRSWLLENVMRTDPTWRAHPQYALLDVGWSATTNNAVPSSIGPTRLRSVYEPLADNSSAVLLPTTTAVSIVACYARDGRDAEFNKWYDSVHMPDVLSLGIYSSGTRYRLAEPPQDPNAVPYLSIYEGATDALDAFVGLSSQRTRYASDPQWASLLGVVFNGGFRVLSIH